MAVTGALLVPIYLVLRSGPIFLFALALFIGGYLVQFLGHALEWSEPGEITAIRQWLGRRRSRQAEPALSETQAS